jgi:hypothetical protein
VVDVQPHVPEVVDHERVSHHGSVLVVRLGKLHSRERLGIERVSRVRELGARREVGGHRREDVAPVEGRRDRLEPMR